MSPDKLKAVVECVNGTAKNISGVEHFIVAKLSVDAYIEHHKMEEVMASRCATGYTLLRMLECKPKNDQDYVTLIWGFTHPEIPEGST